MFRPRHAYRSPITNRYRGKAKGCPVFNNLTEITSEMVEQHDECLECLAKLKNRTELYKTLADNNKPSNNVIKSLQRLSSSASNNRLKTCLQFLIIKVNEKSISNPSASNTTTTLTNGCTGLQQSTDATEDASNNITDSEQVTGATSLTQTTTTTTTTSTRHSTKRQKSYHNQNGQLQLQKQKLNQLASPPQDQVSSTQDQVVGPSQDDHDCQTSPPMLTTTHIDEQLSVNTDNYDHKPSSDEETSPNIKSEGQQTEYISAQTATTTTKIITNNQLSSPQTTCNALSASTATTTTTSNTTSTSSSPHQVSDTYDHGSSKPATMISDITYRGSNNNKNNNQINKAISTSMTAATTTTTTTTTNTTNNISNCSRRQSPVAKKRRRTNNSLSSDQETSSVASWSLASYGQTSSPSPTSSASSTSSSVSSDSETDSLSSFCSSSSCTTTPRNSPSPSPLSSPDTMNELKGPRLKLSEEKIRKIKKRPVLFDDLYYFSDQPSVASTPTTSSGCSPGQHSTATQSSSSSSSASYIGSINGGSLGIALTNPVIHMFQAPPAFVNNLKPCNLPLKSQDTPSRSTTPAAPKVDMINCAICGIRDKPPNISKVYGQNSCALCTEFFGKFLDQPVQLYCAQDGDCLMTFDSRCRACWIKICLQKFDIDEDHRKVSENFSPKLLSSPNVSLITIDTSVTT